MLERPQSPRPPLPRRGAAIGAAVLLAILLAAAAGRAHGDGSEPLNILVYGASGKVGKAVVAEALDRGHFVTAVSRDPAALSVRHDRLSAERGDLLDIESIRRLLEGQDVVVLSVRGVIGKTRKPESALQFIAVKNIVGVMREMADPRPRLIHVGGAGTLEVEPGVLYADRLPYLFLPKGLELEIRGQVLALEYLRGVDDVPWSYATPAKKFTKGKRTAQYRVGGDAMMKNKRGRSKISRADFAVALIDEAETAAHMNERFSIAY
jgi:putative NADH-flavin reductase